MFSLAEESGDHQVRIWRNSNNTLVAGPIPWTFGGDEAWISLDIPDVAIEANTDYTVSVSTGTGPKRDDTNLAADVPVAGNNGLHL